MSRDSTGLAQPSAISSVEISFVECLMGLCLVVSAESGLSGEILYVGQRQASNRGPKVFRPNPT